MSAIRGAPRTVRVPEGPRSEKVPSRDGVPGVSEGLAAGGEEAGRKAFAAWRRRGLAGIDAGLRERDDDPKDRQLSEAHRRIGELNMENELMRARLEKPGPLVRRRSR